MMGYYGNFMGGFGLLGPLVMIVFWGLIIGAVIMLIRWSGGQSACCHGKSKVLDILKERYARGEIDKKEYEDKKKDLA